MGQDCPFALLSPACRQSLCLCYNHFFLPGFGEKEGCQSGKDLIHSCIEVLDESRSGKMTVLSLPVGLVGMRDFCLDGYEKLPPYLYSGATAATAAREYP